jgi:hypothetical protein
MTTSGRVVPTALAASPAAPLPLEAAVPLLVDQDGRLLVNVASSVFPPPVPTPPINKIITQLNANGFTTPVVIVGAALLRRLTLVIYSGAGFVQLWDSFFGPGVGALKYTPIPIPTTLPAYIDVEFDTIDGILFTSGITVAVSTTAPAYTAPAPGAATGTLTTSHT